MTPRSRWALLAGGLVAVVVLFLVLRPGDGDDGGTPSPSPTLSTSVEPSPTEDPTETPTESPDATTPSPADAVEIEVEVEEGRVEGPGGVEVALGERVRLEVKADVADEVHVHGYDLLADVTPDEPAVIVFRADAPGVFEVELEGAGLVLLELTVSP